MADHSPQTSDPFNEEHHIYEDPIVPPRAYIASSRDPEKFARQDTQRSISCGALPSDRISTVPVWENMPDSRRKGEELARIVVC